MVDAGYLNSRFDEVGEIRISEHAKDRAKLRGIDEERVKSALLNGDILGAKPNENPNVGIDYVETYLVLIASEGSEMYYLPVYFMEEYALVATVLKFSESKGDLLEW